MTAEQLVEKIQKEKDVQSKWELWSIYVSKVYLYCSKQTRLLKFEETQDLVNRLYEQFDRFVFEFRLDSRVAFSTYFWHCCHMAIQQLQVYYSAGKREASEGVVSLEEPAFKEGMNWSSDWEYTLKDLYEDKNARSPFTDVLFWVSCEKVISQDDIELLKLRLDGYRYHEMPKGSRSRLFVIINKLARHSVIDNICQRKLAESLAA